MMSLLSELKCLRYEISSSGWTIWAPPNKTPVNVNQRGRTKSPHSLASPMYSRGQQNSSSVFNGFRLFWAWSGVSTIISRE